MLSCHETYEYKLSSKTLAYATSSFLQKKNVIFPQERIFLYLAASQNEFWSEHFNVEMCLFPFKLNPF